MIIAALASSRKASGSGGGGAKTFIAIPTPPAFSNTHTLINATTGNSVNNADTNSKTDLLIGSDYSFLQLNSLPGTTYRLKSLNEDDPEDWAVLGSSGPSAAFSSVTTVPNVELYNAILKECDAVVKWSCNTVAHSQKYQNIIINDAFFAGFQCNADVAGQTYGDITAKFCAVFRSGGEAMYLGPTISADTFYTGISIIENNYTEDTGRESLQCNGHADLRVSNHTGNRGGLDTGAGDGQRNTLQIQNCIGYVQNSIFIGFFSPGMFAVNDFRLENCYLEFSIPDRAIYFQNMVANGYTEFAVPGGTVLIKDLVIVNPDYTLDYMFQLQDPTCHYVFEGDIYLPASATNKYLDQRGAGPYTGSITDNAIWHFTNPGSPTLSDPPEAEYAGLHKVVSDNYWYNRKAGMRTPL